MTDALPIPPERLLEETRWLRVLARNLAGSEDADDLAQDAWLRALEQEPGRVRGLRPWLTIVLRRAFIRGRLGQRARLERERAVARPEAVPSTIELAARVSLHRSIVEAVLSLDEPGRSTVLLRFFDDRPPREIAAIQGVPVETVRTRLRRALAVLRAKLDEAPGGRDRWRSLVAPAPAVVGALIMSTKTKIAAAACVLLLAIAIGIGLGWPSGADAGVAGPGDARETKPVAARVPAGAGATSTGLPAIPPPETAPASSPTRPAPAARSIRAAVHVSDERGDDVVGAAVVLSARRSLSATTDVRGEAGFDLPEPCVATIQAVAPGFADSLVESAGITDGARIQIDLVPLTSLRIHVRDPEGRPVEGASVAIATGTLFSGRPPPGYRHHSRGTDRDGTATFHGIPSMQWCVRIHAAGFVDAQSSPGSRDEVMAGPEDTTIVLKRGAELIVRFEHAVTGAPVEGVDAQVCSDTRKWHINTSVASDEAGVIAIGRPEDATARIEPVGAMSANPNVILVPPDQKTVTIRVSEPGPVACRVVREDQTPVTAAILEYAVPHRLFPVTAVDGRFFVEGQGTDAASHFRFVVPGGVTAWRRLTFWKPEMTPAIVHGSVTIRGQVVDADGRSVAGALIVIGARGAPSIDLGRSQTPQALVTAKSDEDGAFAAETGGDPFYLVEVFTPAGSCARQLVVAHRVDETRAGVLPAVPRAKVDARGVCDVGRIVVQTRTGSLRVTVSALHPGGSEVVATPLGPAADRFPPRRAPVRTNLTASFAALPEGDYDVVVVPGRGTNFIAGLFGSWGTRVTVVGGRAAEVMIRK